MEKIFSVYKKKIDARIIELSQEIKNLNLAWSKEVSKQLAESAIKGKTVRGSLVLMTADLFNKPITTAEITIAASLEYLHTALLVHDDIMDNDDMRRGLPSAHKQYEKIGKDLKALKADELGQDLAICAGDIAIFAANWFIAQTKNIKSEIRLQILALAGEEYCRVGLGQMQDITFAKTPKLPQIDEVLAMYTNKTARYTFSLPLMIGGLLAEQKKETLKVLDKIGLSLGLIFQLTDDALTLHGQSQEVGKAIGNDISENKKTLYHILLRQKANTQDNKTLDTIFGKKTVGAYEINQVKKLLITYQVETEINNLIKTYVKQAQQAINQLPLEPSRQDGLSALINHLLVRTK